MKLRYDSPAKQFLQGIPIGNGRLGAVICGGVTDEILYLNDDSVWYGGFRNRVNPDARENLDHLRKLIFDGKVWEAEKTAFLTLTSTPESERKYQPLASLFLKFYYPQPNLDNVGFLDDRYTRTDADVIYDNYSRELCINSALAYVSYDVDGVTYKREHLASFVDGVIAIKLTCDRPGALSFTARLGREKEFDRVDRGDNHVILSAKTGGDGVDFAVGIGAFTVGGDVEVIGQHLVIQNSDEAVLYLTSSTTFYENDIETAVSVKNKLQRLGFEEYGSVKKSHYDDYSSIYNRVDFRLMDGSDPKEYMCTDERIERIRGGEVDLALQSILYQYGRYLQISSSRKGSLPMNLRGIWNHEFSPAWDGKFTININQQMMYWPSDMCNMSECGQPLFHLMERMYENGKNVAKEMYGCEGFVAHHNTDLWGDCAPQDIHRAAFWCLGAAWLSLHIWDSYDYNRDTHFLKKYYHILEDACRFVLDFLVEDSEGFLVTCPSHSPENGYFLPNRTDVKPSITYAPTMDNMLISYLFRRLADATKALGINSEVNNRAQIATRRLHKTSIGKHGQLMEWVKDYDEPEPGHRHMAHLFALHPADDISLFKTPKLAEAAKISIDRRLAHQCPEDGKNGWTLSWMMLFEARLHRAENAYNYLVNMFKNALAPNMFGLCVTDEIYVLDGNLGMTTAMTELLIQSQCDEIFLLPTLPNEWKDGKLSGIKARGGFLVDVEWAGGKLVFGQIRSVSNTVCTLRTYCTVAITEKNGAVTPVHQTVGEHNTFVTVFNAEKGKEYRVSNTTV